MRPFDLVLPLALAAVCAAELLALDADGTLAALALLVAACGLLTLRRRWPWAVPSAAGILVLLFQYLGPDLDEPATPILLVGLCTWTLGRHLPDLRGLVSLAAFLLVLLTDVRAVDEIGFRAEDVVFVLILLTPPYVAGLGARSLADRNRRLAEQAAELLRLQDAVRAEAAAAERGRIARELHDVIAHSVSAMVLQAAAASGLVRTDPDRAAAAIDDVAGTGRRALAETGRLLHLLRDSDDELELAPDVGLGALPELVDGFRRSGLDVDLEVDGRLDDLPAGVDLSGYRIVQEALTNALKHARDRRTRVRVRREGERLRISAENAAGVPTQRAAGAGLGLVGMAERVAVFGGTLRHGVDDGRWHLDAELPVPQDAP